MGRIRRCFLVAALGGLSALLLFGAASARAAYRGQNGQIAFESFSSRDTEGSMPYAESDAIKTRASTIAQCDNSQGQLSCVFGAPSFSPDGAWLVVSRQVPTDAFSGRGDRGSLMLIRSDSTRARTLPRQTADDEHPAFMPSGHTLVFDGRSSPQATPDLYTVSVDATGLRRLTLTGGSEPAPCADDRIAFVHQGNIYLLSRDQRSRRRLTFRGGQSPSCSPDSRRIAFTRGDQLYTIGNDGRQPHLVSRASAYAPTFSPDGRELAFSHAYDALSQNGSEVAIEVVNARGRRVVANTVVADSSFSGDSGTTSNGSSAGIAWQPQRLPLTSFKLVSGSPFRTGNAGAVRGLALSTAGRLVAAAADNGSVSMFNVRFSTTQYGLVKSVRRGPSRRIPGAGAASFAPSARLLAVAGSGGTISMLSVNRNSGALTPVPGSPFFAGSGQIESLAFRPDGAELAASTSTAAVALFSVDPSTGALAPLPGSPVVLQSPDKTGSVAFNAGAFLAVSAGAQVWLFSVDQGNGTITPARGSPFPAPGDALVQFTPTGGLLASSLVDPNAAGVSASESGGLPGPFGPLLGSPFLPLQSYTTQALSPDQRVLAASDGGADVELASLDPGATRVPAQPVSAGRGVNTESIAFSLDGRLMATGNDGSVSLFAVSPSQAGPGGG